MRRTYKIWFTGFFQEDRFSGNDFIPGVSPHTPGSRPVHDLDFPAAETKMTLQLKRNGPVINIIMISGTGTDKMRRETKQREATLNILRKTKPHPAADQIYDEGWSHHCV
jgi:hypothetical protein